MRPVISSKPAAIWAPVIGVGFLYRQGYSRQVIDKDGAQQTLFPRNDPGYGSRVAVPAARPPADYVARVIPHWDGVAVLLEASRIQWQR